MKRSISTYWKCQLIGWGAWLLFDYFLVGLPFMTCLMASVFGLVCSHFLRFLFKQLKILNKNTRSQIVYLLLLNSIVAFLGTVLLIWVLYIAGIINLNLPSNSFSYSFWREVLWGYQQTLSVGTGWIAIYFAVHYIRDLKKAEQEKNDLRVSLAESETMALRAQMNPHFISNSLYTVNSLIKKNENERAANYLTTLSKLIRTLFQNSDKRKVSLFEELETCRLYAQLESIRFNNKIDFSFEIDETIDLKDIKVPALILQPRIEKAIWHGLMPKETGGRVCVSVKRNNGTIECVIDDDGIGRKQSMKSTPQHETSYESKGIGLTYSKLELEKLLSGSEEGINIIDKEGELGEPAGTKVIFTFNEYGI
ncbi:MAG: sensor histidine kinase [Chitinophagaceae bacterium]